FTGASINCLASAFPLRWPAEDYWRNLTPESAVLTRTFLEACLADKREDRLESAALPVVTAFAFHMQEAYNHLLSALHDAEVARNLSGSDKVSEDVEEELAKREVVLGELLRMAVKLDYMDEIGRRKVYTVTRDILAHLQLPLGLIERCLDVLKEIMPTERELIRVVVEIVIDFRESEEEEGEMNDHDITQSNVTMRKERSLRRTKDRQEMTTEEANFEDNSTLEGIIADLFILAVRAKTSAFARRASSPWACAISSPSCGGGRRISATLSTSASSPTRSTISSKCTSRVHHRAAQPARLSLLQNGGIYSTGVYVINSSKRQREWSGRVDEGCWFTFEAFVIIVMTWSPPPMLSLWTEAAGAARPP
ncbi:hypothetical protein B0H12DRAFT_1278399, partial [Mycena haematopus]